jgi:hypothetical protein
MSTVVLKFNGSQSSIAVEGVEFRAEFLRDLAARLKSDGSCVKWKSGKTKLEAAFESPTALAEFGAWYRQAWQRTIHQAGTTPTRPRQRVTNEQVAATA